jgi:hypothetical protein
MDHVELAGLHGQHGNYSSCRLPKVGYLLRITYSQRIFLVNMVITVPVDCEKFRYLSRKTAAPMDVELDGFPGPHGNVSLPVPNICCSTDYAELTDLPCQDENFRYLSRITAAPRIMLSWLINYEKCCYLSLITASPRMLSWLVFLDLTEISFPVDYEKFCYLS